MLNGTLCSVCSTWGRLGINIFIYVYIFFGGKGHFEFPLCMSTDAFVLNFFSMFRVFNTPWLFYFPILKFFSVCFLNDMHIVIYNGHISTLKYPK
jgi:hypothetical protein